jgi:hypothetical protein
VHLRGVHLIGAGIQIGDSEARDKFSTMRPVGLSHYVCQGKPESEVARGRNCVSKLRPQYIPPLNGVQGIQITDWRDGAIMPAEFIPLLLFKTYYLTCVEIGRQDNGRIFRQARQVLVI